MFTRPIRMAGVRMAGYTGFEVPVILPPPDPDGSDVCLPHPPKLPRETSMPAMMVDPEWLCSRDHLRFETERPASRSVDTPTW